MNNSRLFTRHDIKKRFPNLLASDEFSSHEKLKQYNSFVDLNTFNSRMSTVVSLNGYHSTKSLGMGKYTPTGIASVQNTSLKKLPSLGQKDILKKYRKTNKNIYHSDSKQTQLNSYRKYYNSQEGKFSKEPYGEVILPRHHFQLADNRGNSRIQIPSQTEYNSPKAEVVKKSMKLMLTGQTVGHKSYAQKLKNCVQRIRDMKLTADDLNHLDKVVPKAPYDLPNSKEFISACKHGSLETVGNFLITNRHLVHVFDKLGMTGLHWSAARNRISIMTLLISWNSKLDSKDYVKST